MKRIRRTLLLLFGLAVFLVACGPAVHQVQPQNTVVVGKSFQTQTSPVATPATYKCGAWPSANNPGTYSTIFIYAKLTKNVSGVGGVKASAIVHFKYADQQLDQQPVSDPGGYVTFTLPLQGRQPFHTPATVDVNFSVNGKTIQCSTFFTPE